MTLAIAWVACGDNQRPICEGGLGANRIDVAIRGTPLMLLYRDARNVWLEPDQDEEGKSFLCVEDEYVAIGVCEQSDGSVFTRQTFATVADGPEVIVGPCGPSTEPAPELITVSGSMANPGAVWVAGRGIIDTSSGWTFQIPVTRGPHAVLVTDLHTPLAPGKFSIDRDEFLADTELGTFDVSVKGQTMIEHPLEVTNIDAQDEVLNQAYAYLAGAPARRNLLPARLNRLAGTVAQVIPTESLLEDDYQEVEVVAHSNDDTRRFVRTATASSATESFAMLPRLLGIDYVSSGRVAVWSELPARFSMIQLYTDGEANGANEQFVLMSRRYMDRFGVTELGLEPPPGFDPAWLPAEPLHQDFTVLDETTDVHYGTSVIMPR